MTREEKAKAYDIALARAREIHRNEDDKVKDMEFLFPELKESEVIPKFKVGDKVRLKGSCGWYNVTEIRGVEYYLTSNVVVSCLLPICKQDDWEVEQKPKGIKVIYEVTQEEMDMLLHKTKERYERERQD